MATEYPKDQFDDLPEDLHRVGAHRAPRHPGRAWLVAGGIVLATVLATVLGLAALDLASERVDISLPGISSPGETTPAGESPTPTPSPTAEPVTDPATIDPATSITVLNGTGTAGLAAQVADQLTAVGWPVGSRSNASSSEVATSRVYYADPAAEGIARGVALELGIAEVAQSDQYPNATVTVVLGQDYPAAG